MEATIRKAAFDDLTGILAIMNHNIMHGTAVYDYEPKTEVFIRQWFAEKQKNSFPVVVAVTDGKLSGYGSYAQFKPKDGYKFCVEHSVYVAEGSQGKGIGKFLLAELIRLAKEQGMHSMVALIDADNTGSIAFHKQFGFIEAGLLKEAGFKFGRWLDVQFMQLLLK